MTNTAMQIFKVRLKGYQYDSNGDGQMVRWVAAPCETTLREWFEYTGVTHCVQHVGQVVFDFEHVTKLDAIVHSHLCYDEVKPGGVLSWPKASLNATARRDTEVLVQIARNLVHMGQEEMTPTEQAIATLLACHGAFEDCCLECATR